MKKALLKKHMALRQDQLGVRTVCGRRYLEPARVTKNWSECTCKLCLGAGRGSDGQGEESP